MKRKLIPKRMLSLFTAIVLMSSLFMTFATPVSAIPDCTNPTCLNPEITVCTGTTFNDALLEANGVGCDPVPGTYLEGTDDEYTITVSYDFIQNPIPNQPGTDLEGTAPGAGDYYYHVFCTKYRVVYQDSCSCASVGYIYVEECECNADDITGICVGDTVLTPAELESMGNVSCDGEGCALDSIDHPVGTATYESPGAYAYHVTCYSETCGYTNCDADVIVMECGPPEECCECYAPDVVICEGDDVTAAIMAAGPVCTGDGCAMTLDISGVDNMVAGDYSYTITCENGDVEVCQGTVTVEKECIASAPDITICVGDTLGAPPGVCTVDCDVNVDFSEVDNCTPGTYPYTVTCTDPCGSDCGEPVAQGEVTVLA